MASLFNMAAAIAREVPSLGGVSALRTGNWMMALVNRSLHHYSQKGTPAHLGSVHATSRDASRQLISLAARNAAIVGALGGAALTTERAAKIMQAGVPGLPLPPNLSAASTAAVAEALLLLRVQSQMVGGIAQLHAQAGSKPGREEIASFLLIAAAVAGNSYLKKKVIDSLGGQGNTRQVAAVALSAGWNFAATLAAGKVAASFFARQAGISSADGPYTPGTGIPFKR